MLPGCGRAGRDPQRGPRVANRHFADQAEFAAAVEGAAAAFDGAAT